ncbi:hypothetical protein [Nocardioides humilatus]|nr:hypothetical protein [Nocardioides humilatus]
MNMLISAVVGALAASAVLVGGVNAAQDGQKPVANKDLYTYSSE